MWTGPLLLLCSVLSTINFVENYEIISDKPSTKTPRWLGDILQDTDDSLSSLLSQPVDEDRVQFAVQFMLGYQGLMERLRDAARTRDPRTLQVFRQLKARERDNEQFWAFRPAFMDQLPNLSMRQKELGWSKKDLDTLRTAILKIKKLTEEFKSAIDELM